MGFHHENEYPFLWPAHLEPGIDSSTSFLGSLSIGALSDGGGGGSVKVILESPTHAKQFYDSLASAQIQSWT